VLRRGNRRFFTHPEPILDPADVDPSPIPNSASSLFDSQPSVAVASNSHPDLIVQANARNPLHYFRSRTEKNFNFFHILTLANLSEIWLDWFLNIIFLIWNKITRDKCDTKICFKNRSIVKNLRNVIIKSDYSFNKWIIQIDTDNWLSY